MTAQLRGRGEVLKRGKLTVDKKEGPVPAVLTSEYLEWGHIQNVHRIPLAQIKEVKWTQYGFIIMHVNASNGTEEVEFHGTDKELWIDPLKLHTRHGAGPNESTFPIRKNICGRWFVTAADYYPLLGQYLQQAVDEILIASWWLAPQLYLKRQPNEDYFRLDLLLKRKAEEGVKVYILIYSAFVGVSLNSKQVTKYMNSLSPNILCVPAPDGESLYYTHHQKFVVVDREIAFVGGIDLCFGRYNVPGSPIIDPDQKIFQGLDYYNPAVASPSDAQLESSWHKDVVNRKLYPRMPWQDAQICINGDAARDVALNFYQRWNVTRVRAQKLIHTIIPEFKDPAATSWRGDIVITVKFARNLACMDIGSESDPYCVVKVVQGDRVIGERRNLNRTVTIDDNQNPDWFADFIYPNLLSDGPMKILFTLYDADVVGKDDFLGAYSMILDSTYSQYNKDRTVALMNEKFTASAQGNLTFTIGLSHQPRAPLPVMGGTPGLTCQVVRSVANWSCGGMHEASILTAYQKLIHEAQHFVYIETQFFISDTASLPDAAVTNAIASSIAARIIEAYQAKKTFKVIIVVPLTPEGVLSDGPTQAVMFWQYLTILRNGDKSMLNLIQKQCPKIDLAEYICFYSLVNHALLCETHVYSQIYVHSKLMVVDDKAMIIGSQNINDRSLIGDRDSELAVVVLDDEEKVDAQFGGVPVKVSKFVQSFRFKLWEEHLCITDHSQFVDPTAPAVYNELWMNTAKKNTEIYEQVFPGIPSNKLTDLAKWHHANKLPAKDVEKLADVKGHVIDFPLHFLKDADLRHLISDMLFQ